MFTPYKPPEKFRSEIFPPWQQAQDDGLIAIGGPMNADVLLDAYGQGIFPWPVQDHLPMTWFTPKQRGVLPLNSDHIENHISKNLRKLLKSCPYDIRFNCNFSLTIENCRMTRLRNKQSTWLTTELIRAYQQLHNRQFAYSVEAYHNEKLVGGLYGVCIGQFFSGESMFHTLDNAGKYCLWSLMKRLQQHNISLIDCQMVTPLLQRYGAIYITREEFTTWLQQVPLDKEYLQLSSWKYLEDYP